MEHKPDLKMQRETLGEVRELDAVVAEISTNLFSLDSEQVYTALGDAQQRICACLGLQRSVIWEVSETTDGALELTHVHQCNPFSDLPTVPERPQFPISTISNQDVSREYATLHAEKLFPWVVEQTQQGRMVVVSRLADLPPEAEKDRISFQAYGTKSSIVIPLRVGRVFLGVVSFAAVQSERIWAEELVKRFRVVGQLFSSAIARRRLETSLRRSEERLSLATDSAAARPWEIQIKTEMIWTTQSARDFYGLAPGEDLTLERVLGSIHPEDREKVGAAIRTTREPGAELNVDYRLVSPPGEIRWVSGRGRVKCNATGQPESILGVSIDITDRKRMEEELENRLKEIEGLKLQLEKENIYLREELRSEQGFEKIIGNSEIIKTIILKSKQVAPTSATVLLLGETGTGKGMVADAIHRMSVLKDRPMVTVNCASLPPNLIESELFGREKGAFTGADVRRAGRFEVADRGTIFLDEIGEIPMELQAKLLRILQDGEFERLGSTKTIKVDVRVIAATSRNLREDVQQGRFRQDLFYRLNVFPITIPPLRERVEDIPLLANHFAQKHARKMGKRIDGISAETIDMLSAYDWPGNVRELEHVIQRAVIVSADNVLKIFEKLSSLPMQIEANAGKEMNAVEREHIRRVLNETRGRIEGANGAAAILKLNPSTLRSRMKKLRIRRPF